MKSSAKPSRRQRGLSPRLVTFLPSARTSWSARPCRAHRGSRKREQELLVAAERRRLELLTEGEAEARRNALEIIDRAQRRAQEVLHEAELEAARILKAAEEDRDDLRALARRTIEYLKKPERSSRASYVRDVLHADDLGVEVVSGASGRWASGHRRRHQSHHGWLGDRRDRSCALGGCDSDLGVALFQTRCRGHDAFRTSRSRGVRALARRHPPTPARDHRLGEWVAPGSSRHPLLRKQAFDPVARIQTVASVVARRFSNPQAQRPPHRGRLPAGAARIAGSGSPRGAVWRPRDCRVANPLQIPCAVTGRNRRVSAVTTDPPQSLCSSHIPAREGTGFTRQPRSMFASGFNDGP